MTLEEFGGYKVVSLKFNKDTKRDHWLYLKEHSVREKCPEKPTDRTIFVLGIPPYATESSLAHAFSICGPVKAVYLHMKPTSSVPPKNISKYFKDYPDLKGFKVGYIVFETTTGAKNAMSLDPKTELYLSTENAALLRGVQRWCCMYNTQFADVAELQAEVDAYMADYDKKAEEEEKKLKSSMEPDNEGWITVTRKGKKPGFVRKESVHKKIMAKEKSKRSRKQLLNFYRFQIKESKMNHLASLREKFEEDKKKISILKQNRKFKPFS